MGIERISSAFALAVSEDDAVGAAKTSALYALAVYDGLPISWYTRASQLYALAVYEGEPNPQKRNAALSALYILAVYGLGAPEELRVRAFSFIMDGHKFYVLQLGELGTWIRDTTTGQWHQWSTVGYTRWNASLGLNWDDRTLVADTVSNIVWEVSPDNWQDEGFKDIVHVATAILSNATRNYSSLDEVRLSVSSGFMESMNPRITLEYSDDRGVNYESPADATIQLTVGDYEQEVFWQSLGSFKSPGRVIRITDVGGPLRIDWATVRQDGEE